MPTDAALDARIVVYLGDYVDRGPDSAGVIDLLSQQTLPGSQPSISWATTRTFMLRFLDDTGSRQRLVRQWRRGDAAVLWRRFDYARIARDPTVCRTGCPRPLPPRHLEFLAACR